MGNVARQNVLASTDVELKADDGSGDDDLGAWVACRKPEKNPTEKGRGGGKRGKSEKFEADGGTLKSR